MTVAALIVAAGRGTRMGGSDTPKQFRLIGGIPVISHALKTFQNHPAVTSIALVIHPDDEPLVADLISGFTEKRIIVVHGGATRQSSVCAGLEALNDLAPEFVLIHDGARPFVTVQLCDRVIDALTQYQGALPAMAIADTLKRVTGVADSEDAGHIETMDRRNIYGAQTPQGFRFHDILEAHRAAALSDRDDFTDDASIAEWRGLKLTLVEGHGDNIKITTADDLNAADRKLKYEDAMSRPQSGPLEYRTGNGYDVHRFCEGNGVVLCGVTVPHSRGLKGHSDADVGLHALTDAILGAIGEGDIGAHFPPSDVRWKDAASDLFLLHARDLVRLRDGSITHVDVTLVCEAPKIGPHRARMKTRISEILDIEPDRVSVKATTTEGLGFVGRKEGIAAMASATIALPVGCM